MSTISYQMAVRDFQRARKEAAVEQVLARLRGKSNDLLCYDDVRRSLRAGKGIMRGLQEIPLDKIVGSVGRYHDFTRTFLPKFQNDEERWAQVKAAVTDMKGMPPIEVYQLGDAYFVIDGNHRVSIAHQLGTPTISAYVTEVFTRVPLEATDDLDELICKERYADFLVKTNLDKLRPEANLLMRFCGQFRIFLEQIEAELRYLNGEEAIYENAVTSWYDHVYLPVIEIVRQLGILRRFPELTEADLYVLLTEKQEELEKALGWELEATTAVSELLAQTKQKPLLSRVIDAVAPGLEQGPSTGNWRKQRQALHKEHILFESVLVVLEGIEEDWQLLDQAINMSKADRDHVLGLYLVQDKDEIESSNTAQVQAEFKRRCEAAALSHEFAVDIARMNNAILKRAALADLVIINVTNPPELQPLARLRDGWNELIQKCPRPILAVPDAGQSQLDKMLLAYDGSDKADEALYIATYWAARWQDELTVLTVQTQHTQATAIDRAKNYLEQHGVDWAKFVLFDGDINEAILETAVAHQSNLLIMGGFGRTPMKRMLLGSTVEHMLREFKQPILICR